MEPVLPALENIKLDQHTGMPGASRIDALDALFIVLPKEGAALPRSFPHAAALDARIRSAHERAGVPALRAELGNRRHTRVYVAFTGPESATFDALGLARKMIGAGAPDEGAKAGVFVHGFDAAATSRLLEAFAAAAMAHAFRLPTFKAKAKPVALRSLSLLGHGTKLDLGATRATAAGNNLARWLSFLPPNHLTPALYRKHVARLAKAHGWEMEFLDEKTLVKKGAGAFLAVAQGSATRDAGMLHLRYRPKKSASGARPKLALVGKGICFDTGGTNLKSAKGMFGMHEDMQGSAVALGTFLALSMQKVNYPVDCWLALAQNHIGPKAYKQNDVVRALDGTTIEIVHTDAEGRMVLADTLAMASRSRPGLIMDFATLTGACIYSLSSRYSGVFSNRDELLPSLIEAGRASGERVWPFPTDADFDEPLESDVADIKQCTVDSEADHILAARFLGRFVAKDSRWVHVDLAASSHKGGLAHIPTETTGFGVRFSVEWLESQS